MKRFSPAIRTLVSLFMLFACGYAHAADKAAPAEESAVEAATAGKAEQGKFLRLMAEGRRCMEEKRGQDAVETYEQAVKMEPGNDEAVFALGTALIEVKRYNDALNMLEPLLAKKENRNNASLKNNIAWIYAKATDPAVRNVEKALMYAQEAVLEFHKNPNIWGTLADTHYAAGQYETALRAARIALFLALVSRVDAKEYQELVRRCQRAVSKSAVGQDNPIPDQTDEYQ